MARRGVHEWFIPIDEEPESETKLLSLLIVRSSAKHCVLFITATLVVQVVFYSVRLEERLERRLV